MLYSPSKFAPFLIPGDDPLKLGITDSPSTSVNKHYRELVGSLVLLLSHKV